jgi:hypothetical protein
VFIVDGDERLRALTTDSCLVCANGGFIEFADSGQRQTAARGSQGRNSRTGNSRAGFVGPAADKGPRLPKDGGDLPVRDTVVKGAGGKVDWPMPNGRKGERHMTVTTKSGNPIKLEEGKHFYIDERGKAYFYNNLKTILETQDYTVAFEQSRPKGSSVIMFAAVGSDAVPRMLKEGTDYFLGTDGYSHFNKGKTETDWEFLKRVAAHFNTRVTADHTGAGPRFHIGLPKGESYVLPDDLPYVAGNDLSAFRDADAAGAGSDAFDFFSYRVRHRQIFTIGDRITFLKKRLRVVAVGAESERGELIFTYTLARPESLYTEFGFCGNLKGRSLKGRVIDVRGERLRLHLDIDKEQDREKAFWFPYAPITGNVLYCMPEPETPAHLYFADGREECGQVTDCIRENGDTCGKTAAPDKRY